MILIDECLRNFNELMILSDGNDELLEIRVDILRALECVYLTRIERLVLSHIMDGFNYSEIHQLLNIARTEVPEYFINICRKLKQFLGEEYICKGDSE